MICQGLATANGSHINAYCYGRCHASGQDLAEERKTQREAAYTAQREAEARAEKADEVLDRFRALPEFEDLFGEDETDG